MTARTLIGMGAAAILLAALIILAFVISAHAQDNPWDACDTEIVTLTQWEPWCANGYTYVHASCRDTDRPEWDQYLLFDYPVSACRVQAPDLPMPPAQPVELDEQPQTFTLFVPHAEYCNLTVDGACVVIIDPPQE